MTALFRRSRFPLLLAWANARDLRALFQGPFIYFLDDRGRVAKTITFVSGGLDGRIVDLLDAETLIIDTERRTLFGKLDA